MCRCVAEPQGEGGFLELVRGWQKSLPTAPGVYAERFVINGEEESEIADSLETLAVLYSLQMKGGEGSEGFDSFLSWGPVALADLMLLISAILTLKRCLRILRILKELRNGVLPRMRRSGAKTCRGFRVNGRASPLYNDLHVELKSKGQTTLARATRNQGEKGIA